jgi:hypothetical protein
MMRAAVAAILAATALPALAQTADLTAAQRAAIDRGEPVVVTRERAGSVWPEVTVYVFVAATPLEAAAVFTDYASQSSYIPSVRKSRVSRVIDPLTAEVDYTLSLPVVSDEDYTVRDHVSVDKAGHYRVDWTLVRASSTRATVGHALFATYANARTGATGTLLEYRNFVTPGGRLAGLGFIKSRSIRQVQETARAVAARVELQRRDGTAAKEVERLRSALSAGRARSL